MKMKEFGRERGVNGAPLDPLLYSKYWSKENGRKVAKHLWVSVAGKGTC